MGKTGSAPAVAEFDSIYFEHGESIDLLQCFLGQGQFDFFAVLVLNVHVRFHGRELDRDVDGTVPNLGR